MRDAIVFSTWGWDTFNVPERIALSLGQRGFRVLYCEMAVSRFRRRRKPLREISPSVYAFGPEYLGEKFDGVPVIHTWQWKMVARQIQSQANSLGMKTPLFLYSHVDGIAPLCREMRAHDSRLIHICMDYPETYQYELIDLSDQTLVIPKAVFRELRAKYGEKIQWIPQSIHLRATPLENCSSHSEPVDLAGIPRPRLGYLGPIFARLNLPMLREVLTSNPNWHFFYFGDRGDLRLPNAHALGWHRPAELPSYVGSCDAGIMPYDCTDKRNLHCSPLKLYDYFLAGIPVVATPILELAEFSDLIYFGDTADEFAAAIVHALQEPADSPKRESRIAVAKAHSTEALGRRLEEAIDLK